MTRIGDISISTTRAMVAGEWRVVYWDVRDSAMGISLCDGGRDDGSLRDEDARELAVVLATAGVPADELMAITRELAARCE